MAKYSKMAQSEHLARVRAVLVRKSGISLRQIQKVLGDSKNSTLKLDLHYIGKLVNKIRGERANRLDHHTVNTVLAKFEDEIEELKQRLWTIISDPNTSNGVKVYAIKELRTSSKELFDKMFDAGIFERQLGKLKAEEKLSPELSEKIQQAIDYATGRANKSRTSRNKGKPDSEKKTG